MNNAMLNWPCAKCPHSRREHTECTLNGRIEFICICECVWKMKRIPNYPCECGHLKGRHQFRSKGYGSGSYTRTCVDCKYRSTNRHSWTPMETLDYVEWLAGQRKLV